jgi:hypothetical protein
MVHEYGLPDPVWNVDLRLPGGPHLGGLDAYWPDQAVAVAVAVELDTRRRRAPRVGGLTPSCAPRDNSPCCAACSRGAGRGPLSGAGGVDRATVQLEPLIRRTDQPIT